MDVCQKKLNLRLSAPLKNRSKLTFHTLLLSILVSFSLHSHAQENSDIWVGKLTLSQKHPITELVQITDSDGYTNQPYFFDNSRLFFTQATQSQEEPSQMDIFVFDFVLGTTTNITQSQSSEYSPTPLPRKPGFSVIRVNNENKQELWTINPQGSTDEHLVRAIEPVGYQVWVNEHELLLFVLGEPNTLQRVDTRKPDKMGLVIDRHIGASLYKLSNSDWILYTRLDEGNYLHAYNIVTGKTIQVLSMPNNSEFFSVSSQGEIFSSDGQTLWRRALFVKGDTLSSSDTWQALVIKQPQCSSGISRTAISPDTSMIALVCSHKEP